MLLVLQLAGPPAAESSPQAPDFVGHPSRDFVELVGEWDVDGAADPADDTTTRAEYRYRYVPQCDGNLPDDDASRWVGCRRMLDHCRATGAPGRVAYVLHRAQVRPSPGPWQAVRTVCLDPGQDPGREVPALTVRDLARLPLPAGALHLEPAAGDVLVRVPLNVYARASAHTYDVQVLGQAVQVRVRPVAYRWDFGDGTRVTTSDAGAPYPALQVTHTYPAPGRFAVSVATGYTGRFSVQGGPWVPVEGMVWVEGDPVTRDVVQAEARLVP